MHKLTNPIFILTLVIFFFNKTFAQNVLIKNATVYTMDKQKILSNTDVYVENGEIKEIGRNLSKSKASIYEANGDLLTPGFFAGVNQIGINEVNGEKKTLNASFSLYDSKKEDKNVEATLEFDILDAYNPSSSIIPITRREGYTHYFLTHTNLIGLGHLITLDGKYPIKSQQNSFLYINLNANNKEMFGGSIAAFSMYLNSIFNNNGIIELSNFSKKLVQYYRQSGTIIFCAKSMNQIRQIIELKKRYHLNRVIITKANEAHLLAKDLAQNNIGVILDPLENLPDSFESIHSTMQTAGILAKANVLTAFMDQDTSKASTTRDLRIRAGTASAHGMDWHKALEAMTTNPYEMLGIKNIGKIKVGYKAHLVLWSGDPLEISHSAKSIWINGESQSMENRQELLAKRYLEKHLSEVKN